MKIRTCSVVVLLFLLGITSDNCVAIENNSSLSPSATIFPTDVANFIENRAGCDHFRGEPRDFDESYKREFGKKAEIEEAERAAFLEGKTKVLCAGMDDRLIRLKRKYNGDKFIIEKLEQYEYIDIEEFAWITMHKDFPNAKLIEQKLYRIGFGSPVSWLSSEALTSTKILLIGTEIDVKTAQRIIEVCLELGPKDVGVVIYGNTSSTLYNRIVIGGYVEEKYRVYTGDEIQKLLLPDLTQENFRKYATLRK